MAKDLTPEMCASTQIRLMAQSLLAFLIPEIEQEEVNGQHGVVKFLGSLRQPL